VRPQALSARSNLSPRQAGVRGVRDDHKVFPRSQHLACHLPVETRKTCLAAESLAPMVVAHKAEFSSAVSALIFHAKDLV
jgi:hypothetical protein